MSFQAPEGKICFIEFMSITSKVHLQLVASHLLYPGKSGCSCLSFPGLSRISQQNQESVTSHGLVKMEKY